MNDAISEDSIESDYEIKEDVYRAYTRFCKYHKLPMQSYETFGEILKKDYNYKKDRKRINSKKQTVWAGIKLVKWNNNDPLQQTLLEESDDDNEGAEEDNNNDNAK
ncbi:MAG TPA: hypothetical protein VLA74_01070 [Nitrososphaeraceae archaeon]|nr:hypothetical protein [Nitrososphaeraceae archaeon]